MEGFIVHATEGFWFAYSKNDGILRRYCYTHDEQRVEAALTASAARPEAIPDRIVDALDHWREGRTLDDDLTVLVCERTPEQ